MTITSFKEPLELADLPFIQKKGRGSMVNLYLNEADYSLNTNKTIGMEWEFGVSMGKIAKKRFEEASTKNVEYLQTLAKKRNCSLTQVINALSSDRAKQFYIDYVSKATSPIIHSCHEDGSFYGPENVMLPVSLAALPLFKFEMQKVLNHMMLCGAEDRTRGAGIHFHTDNAIIGSTKEEQKHTLEQYVLFNYYNSLFITNFSYRNVQDEASVDFEQLVFRGTVNAQQRLLKLVAVKIDLVSNFLANKNNRTGHYTRSYGQFNHVTQANELPLFETRIYGSTTDIEIAMGFYEYEFMKFPFCATLDYNLNGITVDDTRNSLEKMCEYADNRKVVYPHLVNRLRVLESTKEFMTTQVDIYLPKNLYSPDFYTKECKEAGTAIIPSLPETNSTTTIQVDTTTNSDVLDPVLGDIAALASLRDRLTVPVRAVSIDSPSLYIRDRYINDDLLCDEDFELNRQELDFIIEHHRNGLLEHLDEDYIRQRAMEYCDNCSCYRDPIPGTICIMGTLPSDEPSRDEQTYDEGDFDF